ncbi:hypothetical protein LWI28_007755 [Acer negundo]|uniref:GATA-type domain-containing protein n=1 Tax=Acer negundo TaxID=4023 RepID=A0AAD5J3X2_ACENE|nr:hypothetical protein LWI28_007755 [Acer negundo]
MDFCRNVSVPGECQQEPVMSPPCSKLGSLTSSTSIDDLFPAQNTEVDVSLEWLSIFVEDCLSSTGNCLPVAAAAAPNTTSSVQTPNTAKSNQPKQPQQTTPPSLQKFVVPSKARSKRKRATTTTTKSICSKSERSQLTSWTHSLYPQDQFSSDPPLLHQTYWLADSELILPKKEEKQNDVEEKNVNVNVNVNVMMMEEEEEEDEEEEEEEEGSIGNLEGNNNGQQPRRCTHCLSQRTPQWRAGPLGPKTLCNACGVRYKSGRLLPEYRPAKSPTFVSYLHSNSHKKVMEMRTALLPSVPK